MTDKEGTMAEKTEGVKVDHIEEARRALQRRRPGPDLSAPHESFADPDYPAAQAHASIAIAERLSDIAHELEELNVRLTR